MWREAYISYYRNILNGFFQTKQYKFSLSLCYRTSIMPSKPSELYGDENFNTIRLQMWTYAKYRSLRRDELTTCCDFSARVDWTCTVIWNTSSTSWCRERSRYSLISFASKFWIILYWGILVDNVLKISGNFYIVT